MSLPENHLDLVANPGSIDPARRAPLRTVVIATIALPLLFMVSFSLAYISALHEPAPHDLALTIAGPASVTQSIASSITDKAPHAFDITQTTDAAAARDAVAHRDAVGAISVDGTNVTTIVASAGGLTAVSTVESVGKQVAAGLGGSVTVDDVAPVASDDSTGTVLFFLLVVCTIGSYLAITGLAQVFPRAGLRFQLATAAGAAIVFPLLGFAVDSLFVGDYGQTFGDIAALLGVAMLYSFTVGLLATLFTRLLGQGGILGVVIVVLALNFVSSGGPSPASMLPGFWQVVHNGWFGAGALESMRSIVYFNGNQVGHWMLQLGIWTVGVFVLVVAQRLVQGRRAGARRHSEATASVPATSELVTT